MRGWIVLLALVGGCGSDDARRAPDAAPDAALDAARDAALDAGAIDWACGCEEDEDCAACFENIGRCCYDDPTLGGQAGRIADTCARTGGCRSCCNECAGKNCAELEQGIACPAAPPL